jgi:membrane-bound serine protease (ClpP class)
MELFLYIIVLQGIGKWQKGGGRMKRKKPFLLNLLIATAFFFTLLSATQTDLTDAAGEEKLVYVVPVKDTVEKGLASFIDRALKTAADNGADHILLEIDTPGGYVNAAGDIVERLQNSEIPTTAFVVNKAISAGSYITLNADTIIMAPGSTMGAAAIIDAAGNAAGKKAQSYWRAEMRSSATAHNRDPRYALAMLNPDIDMPEYGAEKGELLTLSAKQALEVGYADALAETRANVLDELGLSGAVIEEVEASFAEKVARFLTSPFVVPILLAVGTLGFVIEFFSPGFGIPGIVGAVSILLYFFGHMVAGLAGWESLVLLAAGIILLLLEVVIPGGILGVIGIAAIIVAVFLSAASFQMALVSIFVSLVVTVVGSFFVYKYWGYRGVLKKLVLNDATHSHLGYLSNVNREELLGLEGEAQTTLRPAGIGIFDNERLDVVSEGGYITKGKKIKIVKTEGSRVVVRELKEDVQKVTK